MYVYIMKSKKISSLKDSEFEESVTFSKSDKGLNRTPDKMIDISTQETVLKTHAIDNNILRESSEGVYDVNLSKKSYNTVSNLYQDMCSRYGNDIILETADNSFRVRKIRTELSSPVAIFQDVAMSKKSESGKNMLFEFASNESDNSIGIPYTLNSVPDRLYVINGRVYSGFSMWFGVQSIRSPEDYARNVDLTYNVPFVNAGFQLKGALSLGASFDIVHGSEEEETPEEALLKNIFFGKLNINTTRLKKTSFHLDTYGNAYWHIRRDKQGFPDKVTILQPERVKVFLDPRTTKILYYVYLPPILAGMALTPYPNVRDNPNLLHGPALSYPTPIVIDPQDIIHFKENDYTEYPFGLSCLKSVLDPCTARLDINLIAPMIFKRYAKPYIHWRLDPMVPFQLTKGQIEGYIDGMKNELQNMEPMSDPITTTRWSAQTIGAAQGKAELLTILQDMDNQIFSAVGVPEPYFKPQSGSDRMISEQDKTLMAAMKQRQDMVGNLMFDKIIKTVVDTYDMQINKNLIESGMEPMPERQWNQYPQLQWRETFKQDQTQTIQNTLALVQSGIIDHSRAARRVGEYAPSESEELRRQRDLQKISEEVQIGQAKVQMLQTQMQIMQAEMMLQNPEMMLQQMAGEGGEEGSPEGGKKPKKTPDQQSMDKYDEDSRYRVTFLNKAGKRQTEIMKGSTVKSLRGAGKVIENVQAVSTTPTTKAQDSAKEALK
jgi:hypothetical protein